MLKSPLIYANINLE